MKQEEINKYSVLIAEFMGKKVTEFTWRDYSCICECDEEGNVDWYDRLPVYNPNVDYNELMPVWVKFRDLEIDYKTDNLQFSDFNYIRLKQNLEKTIMRKPIEKAFEELGKAIEWYNKIKRCNSRNSFSCRVVKN